MEQLIDNLFYLIDREDMSFLQLSRALRLSESYFYEITSKDREMSIVKANKVAKFFKVNLDELMNVSLRTKESK